jgi:sugar lactone lactonase YvrE
MFVTTGGCKKKKKKYIPVVSPFTMVTTSLPNANFGKAYSEDVIVHGGFAPYTWSVSEGNLPDGLTLDTSTGNISGKPSKAGSYSFTIRVKDSLRSVSRDFTVSLPVIHYAYEFQVGVDFEGTGNFKEARDIAADSLGNLYILERNGNKILVYDSSGTYTREIKSGQSTGWFYYADKIVIDTSDNLYIGDGNRVIKLDNTGSLILQWYGDDDTSFDYVADMATDANDNVYILDDWLCRVCKFDSAGNLLLSFGNEGTGDGEFENPYALTADSNNNVYVVDDAGSDYRVQKFNSSGNFVTSWTSAGYYIRGIAADSTTVYVLNTAADKVEAFDDTGSFLFEFGGYGSANGEFDYATAIAAKSGSVHVADFGNYRVQKFDASGAFQQKVETDITSNGKFNRPADVAVTADFLFVCDTENNRVQKLHLGNGAFISTWGTLGSADGEFDRPMGIAVDENNSWVYLSDTFNDRVQKFDFNGTHLLTWGSFGASDGQFDEPAGIEVDSQGNVLVIDTDNYKIQKFDSDGNHLLTFGEHGTGQGQFQQPQGIAVNSADDVYITDGRNNCINVFDNSGAFLSTIYGFFSEEEFMYDPYGIDIAGGYLYVSDDDRSCIYKMTFSGELVAKIGSDRGAEKGKFDETRGLAVNTQGRIYIADQENYRVQVFSPNPDRGIAPELSVQTWLQGGPYAIHGTSCIGKVTVIVFWEYWFEDTADLNQLYSDYNENQDDVVVASIATYGTSETEAGDEIINQGMLFPVAVDVYSDTAQDYKVYMTPSAAVIDQQGNVIWKGMFIYSLVKDQVDALLN